MTQLLLLLSLLLLLLFFTCFLHPTGCDVPKADILFVLDGSGSIGPANFQLMKDFVEDVVSDYDIGADAVRVGLIEYSSSSSLQFGLGAHSDLHSLLVAIDSVPYTSGGTASDLALRVSATTIFLL